jgi:outer membrane receptor for ferrienterochelin and colicin
VHPLADTSAHDLRLPVTRPCALPERSTRARRVSRPGVLAALALGGAVLGASFPSAVAAQQPAASRASAGVGRVTGRIVDAATQIVGTTVGTMSGVDGRFTLAGVPAGPVSIQARRIGYAPKTVTGVVVPAGGAVEQDITLGAATVQLQAVSVTAAAERGSVSAVLDQQRNATGVVSAISAAQIARSPDADAAAAVQRVSGVTVQDGRYVFVRGLGERYTTASLNGARIPSPEPERKVVPLDLFPSGLLQTVTTNKTFTPDLQGDFSGAQVNIQTREFPAARQVVFSSTVGTNTAVTSGDRPGPRHAGLEWFGLAGRNRELPAIIARAGTFETAPSQGDVNRMVNSFRNSWSPRGELGAPNGSFSASVGGNDPLFGQRVGYVLSGTYSASQEAQADYQRGQAQPGSQPGIVEEVDRYDGAVGRTSVLWGGIANFSTLLGTNTRLSVNNTYNRTADNEARTERGFSENLGTALDVQRLRYVERSVRSNQLKLEQSIGDRQQLDASVTSSGTTRAEPDRSEFVRAIQRDPATNAELAPAWLSMNNEGAVRTFADLRERNVESMANYRLTFGRADRQHHVKAGALYRTTDRTADNQAYSIVGNLTRAERELPPEEIFGGRFSQGEESVLRIVPLGQGGSYEASDRLAAGYGMVDFGLTSRFRLVTGARVEHSAVDVTAQPTVGNAVRTTPSYTDVLPSLALNVSLTEKQTLRVSGSQTLSRPEYRELAPIQFREVIGGDNVIGNADLRRTLIQNADVRWEWYPREGELLSVAAFGKRFQDPIERIYLATSGTRVVTFANADAASNYGVELEARKGLGFLGDALRPLGVFSNVTLMKSDIRIGQGGASRTNDHRPMVGQAPYVVNAGMSWASPSGDASATLLYNVVGERIVNAAEAPLPDVKERPRNVLDLSLRFPMINSVSARVDARNLLDAPYRTFQGTALRESYRAGRVFQVGLTWRPEALRGTR